MVNDKFGRLTVIDTCLKDSTKRIKFLCRCSCGVVKVIEKCSLTSGRTKSCGCLASESASKRQKTHGLSLDPLYKVYSGMMGRCYDTNRKSHKIYGAAGVTVCDEWKNDITAFVKWAKENGWRHGLHLDKDKIAMEKGLTPNLYSPERCSFLTPTENCNFLKKNIRISYNNETHTLAEWARITGIKYPTLQYRLNNGFQIDLLFSNKNYTNLWRSKKSRQLNIAMKHLSNLTNLLK